MFNTAMLKGWNIDLAALYGEMPRDYAHEDLFESPDGEYAVVLYGIAEVGVMKEAGRVAVFRNKTAPVLLFRPENVVFWYSGESSVEFDQTGRLASLDEFRPQRWYGGWPSPRKRVIELAPDA